MVATGENSSFLQTIEAGTASIVGRYIDCDAHRRSKEQEVRPLERTAWVSMNRS